MEVIKEILEYAKWAPSTHNSQPWLFKIGEGWLEVYGDFSRKLKEADRTGRMFFMSLGCLIFNIKVAADYFGVDWAIEYPQEFKEKDGLVLVAKFILKGKKESSRKDLFEAIKKRRSNRNKYLEKPVAEEVLKEVEKIASLYDRVRLHLFSDKETIKQIAQISSRAMGKMMSRRAFRRELADWLRVNFTLKKDGMPGATHGMSFFTSIIAPFILRNIDVSKVEAKKEFQKIINLPTVGIISSKNNPTDWLQAGELLENILLFATSRGVDTIIRVASIEEPEESNNLKKFLGLTDSSPQMLFGLGHAKAPAAFSPRRDLNDLIINS